MDSGPRLVLPWNHPRNDFDKHVVQRVKDEMGHINSRTEPAAVHGGIVNKIITAC